MTLSLALLRNLNNYPDPETYRIRDVVLAKAPRHKKGRVGRVVGILQRGEVIQYIVLFGPGHTENLLEEDLQIWNGQDS